MTSNGKIRAVFFDAGNTLLFADRELTLAPLLRVGITPNDEQIRHAEKAGRKYRDANPNEANASADLHYWEIYYRQLLDELGINNESLWRELVASTRKSGNWRYLQPGTRDALLRMKQKYALAVISNSDGGIRDAIHAVGLGDCFAAVTDSTHVGVEKPRPEIFHAAVGELGVKPHESVYVGDIYSIDYVGARNAGLSAIMMDVYDAYADTDLPRVSSLLELEKRLAD